jgi:D-serine deaminase-like pyridoxal phosphate-dependent protein
MERIGKPISELDTPTLLIDLKRLQNNIATISKFAKEQQLQLRPHIKTHKSIKIAKMQLASGAVGITVAKIAEAEVMETAGIKDILIAFPISSPQKVERLKRLLSKGVKLKVAVDSLEQLKHLQKGLESSPYTLEVWIKINSGLNRCGVEPGKEAVNLAQAILFLSKLRFGGLFTHAGQSYAATSIKEIEEIGKREARSILESAEMMEQMGIPVPVKSVGSTPTYQISGTTQGITEIRPGNAVFFDAIQVGLGVASLDQCALSILSSVVGIYHNRMVFDAGSKSLSLDKGAHGNNTVQDFGHIMDTPELTLERLSEEHGVATYTIPPPLTLNQKVQIIPNHACTAANLFHSYVVHSDGMVVDIWNVDARGMVQ